MGKSKKKINTIKYAKNEIKHLAFYRMERIRLANEIEDVAVKLKQVKGMATSQQHYIALSELKRNLDVLNHQIKRIETFRLQLTDSDRKLIDEIYLKGRAYDDVSIENGFSRRSLVRYIDKLLEKF